MNAALGFGGGHALHAVAAGLKLKAGIGAFADHAADHFLVAAQIAFVFTDNLNLPALTFGVAQVHAQKVPGKKRGFVTTGARTDFQKDVAAVVGVLG